MKLKSLAASAFALLPVIASAHPGHEGDHDFGWDFTGGLSHPLTGLDHLLAMIAVGLWAARLGGRAQWVVPSTFLATLALGASAAGLGLTIPAVEPFVAASLVGLGLLIALAAKWPTPAAASVVALFAFFHGYAHGTEMPAGTSGLQFGLGFLVASAGLHAVGYGLGRVTERSSRSSRAVGAGIAAAGLWVMLA